MKDVIIRAPMYSTSSSCYWRHVTSQHIYHKHGTKLIHYSLPTSTLYSYFSFSLVSFLCSRMPHAHPLYSLVTLSLAPLGWDTSGFSGFWWPWQSWAALTGYMVGSQTTLVKVPSGSCRNLSTACLGEHMRGKTNHSPQTPETWLPLQICRYLFLPWTRHIFSRKLSFLKIGIIYY